MFALERDVQHERKVSFCIVNMLLGLYHRQNISLHFYYVWCGTCNNSYSSWMFSFYDSKNKCYLLNWHKLLLCQYWPRKVTTNPLIRNFSLYTETFLAKIVVRCLLAAFPDVRTVCLCSWRPVARSCTSAGRWYRERMVMWVAVQEVNSVWPQWAVDRWIWRPRHVMKTVIQMTRAEMPIRG